MLPRDRYGPAAFRLGKALRDNGLMAPIRAAASARHLRILGVSAGANIVGLTLGTTNDNPVVALPPIRTAPDRDVTAPLRRHPPEGL